MYRMNCNLADDLGNRLCDYCARTGVAKVTVVSLALDQYLSEQEMKRKLVDELSDPMKMAQICKLLGMNLPSGDE